MYKILLVEDDINLANQVKEALMRFNYEVVLVDDFTAIDQLFEKEQPHLVIMDINLPYQDGFYWTNLIRAKSKVPILFMSSRDQRLEKVMAMTMGADDYITKPIDLELTTIKIQALLRRAYDYESKDNSEYIASGGFVLDLKKFELNYHTDKIDLTKNEFKILQCLMSSVDEFVSREDLMNFLWDHNSFIDDNAFNVNVSRLRNKIKELSGKDYIETKRNVGYRFVS